MYKSKYGNLIQNLMNEYDLILLDSEQQEIERWVEKDLEAISVTRCCKSDSEQLVCDCGKNKPVTREPAYIHCDWCDRTYIETN